MAGWRAQQRGGGHHVRGALRVRMPHQREWCVPCLPKRVASRHARHGLTFASPPTEPGLFTSQRADGIMGLSRSCAFDAPPLPPPPLACRGACTGCGACLTPARVNGCCVATAETIISKLHSSGKLDNYMFSMCLTLDGGVFNLGDDDTRLHSAPMKFTGSQRSGKCVPAALTFACVGGSTSLAYVPSLVSSHSFWKVVLESVQVEGQSGTFTDSRANSGQGTIVDSGTSFGYLPSGMFSKVLKEIKHYCSSSSKCKGTSTLARCEATLPPVVRVVEVALSTLNALSLTLVIVWQAPMCRKSRCATR